ncbi:hypothetical protein ACKKBG_A29155 [Auxenochlorella protothecoides x Auxenochlorella symbiontica]
MRSHSKTDGEPDASVYSTAHIMHSMFTPGTSRVSFELEESIAMQLASDMRGDRLCSVACSLASCLILRGSSVDNLVLPVSLISDHVQSLIIRLQHLPHEVVVEVGHPTTTEPLAQLDLPLAAGGRWLGSCKYSLAEAHIPSTLPTLRLFTNKLAQWLTHFLKQSFEESWEKHMLEIQQQGSPAKPPSCTEVKSIC